MKKLEKSLDNLAHVYRLTGEDALQIEKAMNMIETSLNLQMPEVNKSIFTDDNFDAEKIILSCRQMPFVSEKRLVVVKNVVKIKDSDLKKLDEYCKNPEETTVLVFQEIVGNNAFGKLTAEKVLCNKLSEQELTKLVQDELKNYPNKTITPEALKLFIDFCANDSLRIKNELSKLMYAEENKIDENLIKKFVKKSDEYSVFEITTALSLGQGEKAIILMKKMLETTEFPIILGLISSHFRRVLYSVMSEGTNFEIAEKLGVKEFAITKAKNLAKNISVPKLLKINETILNVDYDIKNGKISAENAMYYLVFQIIALTKG